MRVELPQLCAVLAHEIRSPLSVLQGYIRLLQRQREPEHPESAMLSSMLAATGRLAAIGRQASDLGLWLGTQPSAPGFPSVSLSDLFAEVERRLPNRGVSLTATAPSGAAGDSLIHADKPMLAESLIALAEATGRDAGAPATITPAGSDPDGKVVVRISVVGNLSDRPAPPSRQHLAFDRGGAGLALVTASYVLEAHGATASLAETPGSIEVRLPSHGGSE